MNHTKLIRELVDLSASSHSLSDYYASTIEVLARLVGFDNAIVFSPQIIDESPLIYGMCPESRSLLRSFLREFSRYGATPSRAAELATIHEVITDELLYADLGISRERDPFDCDIMRPSGVTSAMDIAVRLGPQVFAFISLHRAGGRRFSSKEAALLKPVAPALGAAVASLSLRVPPPLDRALAERLSERERQIVRLAACGLTNKGIATALGSSPHTVRNQLHTVFSKLSITCRAELVRWALARMKSSIA